MTRVDCLRLLRTVPVGRVGITVGALPVILPVNFLFFEAVVFRTVPRTKLAAATASSVVAFEGDDYEIGGALGWSVVVQGTASEVTAPGEKSAISAHLGQPWGSPGKPTALSASASRRSAVVASVQRVRRYAATVSSSAPTRDGTGRPWSAGTVASAWSSASAILPGQPSGGRSPRPTSDGPTEIRLRQPTGWARHQLGRAAWGRLAHGDKTTLAG